MQRVTVSFSVDIPNGASVLASAEAMRLGATTDLRRHLLETDERREDVPVVVHVTSFDCYRDDDNGLSVRRRG